MRKLVLGVLGATALMGATAASAVEFVGSTTGCLQVVPGPACTLGTTSNIGGPTGLVYNFGTFDQFTAADTGYAAIGGTDSLGSFTLGANPTNYTNDLFKLLVTFTAPGGVSGGGTFNATLIGSVTGANNGGVTISFTNPTQVFHSSIGDFTLGVNPVSISGTSGTPVPITGFLQLAAVPEPATWAMMLVGFGGIGMAMRRRRRPVLAQLA